MSRPPRDRSGDYEVGKYRPPVKSRFKKGQSGNPRGRKKGSKNRKTIVLAAERKTFPVLKKSGRKQMMTCTEVGLERLQQEVLHGDRKAFLDYLAILERYSDRDEVAASLRDLLAEDKDIMLNLLARNHRREGNSNGDE